MTDTTTTNAYRAAYRDDRAIIDAYVAARTAAIAARNAAFDAADNAYADRCAALDPTAYGAFAYADRCAALVALDAAYDAARVVYRAAT